MRTKMCNSIELKKVKEIINGEYKFILPIYQRGYRWTENEVDTLIEDVNGSEEGYFLQVLTVKKEKDGKYLLVDGQQRLTTIFLLLGEELGNYFPDREDDEINKFYIGKITKSMLGKVDKEKLKNASFLLYEVKDEVKEEEDDNGNKIFERLNSGKIPLSSAEILKAKAISEIEDESEKTEFALRWQNIERRLQDDDFFFYICPYRDSERYEKTRMDYILELLYMEEKETKDLDEEYEKNPLFVFNALDSKYISGGNQQLDGKEVTITEPEKKEGIYQLLDEIENLVIETLYEKIFCNTSTYNAFGYYLYKKRKEASFPKVKDIKERVALYDKYAIDSLSYGNKDTYNTLLKYNILKHSERKIRFDFIRFSQEQYDVEHIYARNSQDPDSKTMETVIDEIIKNEKLEKSKNEDIKSLLEVYKSDKEKEENLGTYYDLFMDLSEGGGLKKDNNKYSVSFDGEVSIIDKEERNSIKNLTLLPSSVNISISNYPFPIKVKKVIEAKLRDEHYIPEFSYRLYFSNKAKLRWGNSEAQEYLEDIKETLSKMGEQK